MSPRAVHQLLPIFEPGAVGAHALAARDALRAAGHASEIFTVEIHPAYAGHGARDLREHARIVRPGDRNVYQMAIGSPVADYARDRPEPLVVNHHNLTPLRYFAGWEPVAAHGVVWGRQQLRELAGRAALGVAVSRYNEADLVEAGFARTAVVPYLLDRSAFAVEPDAARLEALRATSTGGEWLFVGRQAPNKAQHDLVKAFAAYRRFHDPGARLHLVGGGADSAYGHAVTAFATSLGLGDAVVATGPVSAAALAAHYEAADVFVVTSEHEGFCVPLLEAMSHRLPIVAFAEAAVPETLGDAGVLLDTKDPCTIAVAVERVLRDEPLRTQLVAAGTRRLAEFDLARTGPQFVAAVTAA
jgi:glycosyltransferase involved in cell wall biosynthesis